MCRKLHKEDPREEIDDSARELGVIADMLRNSQYDSDILVSVVPGDLGKLLSGLRDRLILAAEKLPAPTRPLGNG